MYLNKKTVSPQMQNIDINVIVHEVSIFEVTLHWQGAFLVSVMVKYA